MAKLGFNIIRIPISAEIILQWKNGERVETSFVNTYENPRLDGLSSLEILDYTINHMKKNGLKVMLDMHGASKDSYQDNLWYNKDVTMEDFIEAWKWITERYKDDDTVIAMDLKNEPTESSQAQTSQNGMAPTTRTIGKGQPKLLPKKYLQLTRIF